MAVVANADGVAGQSNEAFDVKLVGGLAGNGNVPGFEDDDFAAFRVAEIIGQAVHEQMVAGIFDELEDGGALLETVGQAVIVDQSEAVFGGVKLALVRSGPEGEGSERAVAIADPESLFVDNAEGMLQRAGIIEFAVGPVMT